MITASLASFLWNVTVLLALALVADAALARRRPLAASALWNGVLVAILLLPPASCLLPHWELPILPHPTQTAQLEIVERESVEPPPVELPASAPPVADFAGPAVPSQPAPAAIDQPALRAAPAANRTRRAPTAWPIGRIAIALYVLGLGMALVRLAASWRAVARLRAAAEVVTAPAWLERGQHWRHVLGRWARFELLASLRVGVPIVLGIRRPAIVLPEAVARQQRTTLIDAVLVHELAHVWRRDCAWQFVERVALALVWFHPLAWLARRRIAAVRERACDDFAIHTLADRQAYAETLLNVAGALAAGRPLALGMAFARSGNLARRLETIAASHGNRRCALGGGLQFALACGVSLFALGLSSLALGSADPPADAPATPAAAQTGADAEDAADADYQRSLREQITATRFRRDLEDAKYDKAVAHFAPALRSVLPSDGIKNVLQTLSKRYGKLYKARVTAPERVGNDTYLRMRLIWQRDEQVSQMDVRFTFNDDAQITGIWLGPVASEEAVRDQERADENRAGEEFRFGQPIERLAAFDLSLRANVLAPDGQPAAQAVPTFFRALESGESPQSDDWQDTATQATWRPFDAGSADPLTAVRLAPGRYRVAVLPGQEGVAGATLGEPLELDDSRKETTLDLRLEPGQRLNLRFVDADSGQPIPPVPARLVADDDRLPHFRVGGTPRDNALAFEHLTSGRYRIEVPRQSRVPDELEYAPVEVPPPVDVAADRPGEVTLKMRRVPMTDEEIARRWPWVVQGRVVDADGQPIEGAELKAHCGMGTLRQTGHATSGADGRYTLRFSPGLWSNSPYNVQVAQISVAKDGMYDRNLQRPGQLMMARRLPPERERYDRTYVLPNAPYEVNFVLLPTARLSAQFLDAGGKPLAESKVWLEGESPLPRFSATTDELGRCEFAGVATNELYWGGVELAPKRSVRSMPFKLSAADDYRMRLELTHDDAHDVDVLTIKSITGPAEANVTQEAVLDDPLLRPPLADEFQTAGRQVAARLLEVNRHWLGYPPAEVKNYAFDFHLGVAPDGTTTRYQVAGHRGVFPLSLHGTSYASALRSLEQPENVVFRAIEITPERIVLAYTLKQPFRAAAGNGVQGTWSGYFSMGVSGVLLVLDAQRYVPLEVEAGRLREAFEDYAEISPGHFAPRRVRIEHGGMRFDWSFTVYEPGLWLLSASRNVREPDAPPRATIDAVEVNGAAAKPLD